MVKQYATQKLLAFVARYMRRRFDRDTKHFMKCQEQTLLERLRASRDSAYGRDHNLSGITSLAAFRSSHPVTEYGHYDGYVRRLADGERDVLFTGPPRSLACTSGTSGGSKLMPVTSSLVVNLVSGVLLLLDRQLVAFPGAGRLQRQMRPVVAPRWRYSPGGLPIGPASVAPPGQKDGREHTQFLYSSPPAANDIPAEPAAVYVHLLFGLRDRELGAIEANFASFVYSVFSALERDWQRLARDLAAGRLGKDVEVPDSVRTACDAALSPEPARAAELREIFESEDAFRDGRLARRVWPHLNFITTVTSGAMQLYAARLQRRYTGQVPLYSALYAATEGLLGVNLWPEESQPRYVLHPRAMLFEFGETAGTDGDKILLASELEVGGEYELIVTNRSGMFRFRMGDVVRVVDFYNGAPIVEFLYRKGQLLDVHSEKMSEAAFFGALRSAADGWSSTLVDYTTAESVLLAGAADNPPHYVVLLELNGAPLTDDERQKVDESLCAHHEVYRSFRAKAAIGPAQVVCLRPGAFERLRQHVLANSDTSALQFKVPRVLRTESLLQLMLEERHQDDLEKQRQTATT
ncbi:probable indole-3-acetic acid-amido synthetase GH3.9 [Amphibalanus amphitrite]|uniref:probable indole-3-acetic acid-amido synthetase GH3.9 n=1 Tax=Amphibalanus amphitrite TaxID=1232801 RepID=UPI001C91E2CF|nr:probable indole-3-acetic acid-amido synthetase GH3.9 [Amphibalanus amphitrite]XP_043192089.1 probable indole-3-acetic acid-amido synthetase GH3.9 [Amphibalanus amphitrite]XP_043192090.1 probable indole-3-acetic acid-amido synthetase GH3.9 [Amphibalanus amphitrite]XP_043192091.1 probable indole-3-acetic acid-amido synthetase GH3.9 [Amphibalanus amphitrite]